MKRVKPPGEPTTGGWVKHAPGAMIGAQGLPVGPDAAGARTGGSAGRPRCGGGIGRQEVGAGLHAVSSAPHLPLAGRTNEREGRPSGRPSSSPGTGLCLRRGRGELAQRGEPLEGLALELADALARQAQPGTDRLERPRVALEAEAQLEDAPLALGERVERLADALLAERLLGLVERVGCVAVGEQVAELALVVGADALVERDGGLRGRERLVHVLDGEPGRLGELLAGRVAAQLDLEPARGAAELLLALDDVHGHSDRARVVGHSTLHRLADPPRRVGRELEAAAPVELLDGAVEAERALLDEIQEGDAEAAVALGDRHDEAQVRLDHAALCEQVALLHPLRERDLLVCGEELVPADVREEELQAVARPVDRVGGRRGSFHRLARGSADLEPDRLELVRHLGHLVVAEIELERKRLELGGLNEAALLGALDQVATCLGVKNLVHGVLSQLFLTVLSLNEGRWIPAAHALQRSHCKPHSRVRLPGSGWLNPGLTRVSRTRTPRRLRCWRSRSPARRPRPPRRRRRAREAGSPTPRRTGRATC